MFSSDATQLTEFGNAKAWPIYMMLGNLLKYIRSSVSSGAMHHLAYIPSLPESFKAFASRLYAGSWHSQEPTVVAHCRHELMHAVWIVVTCIDSVEWRIYPRIFSYSADYPEKVSLATIHDKGLFPCPRCLVHHSELHNLGLRRDKKTRMEKLRVFLFDKVSTAHDAIYRLGHTVRGPAIEALLNGVSAVPTINAFIDRLGKAFNPSTMLTVDLLQILSLEHGKPYSHTQFALSTLRAIDAEGLSHQDAQARHSACEQTLKPLNLSTIKFHFMGDYGEHIRRFGTTDSYSTQLGEQSHCAVKRLYGTTNKKNATHQIGAKYLRQQVFRAKENQERHEAQQLEHLEKHHVISHNTDEPINIFEFVRDNSTDPAKKGFISKLKDHILGRLMNQNSDGDMHNEFSSTDRNNIHIRNNRIFCHHTIRINYTTYDIRRNYDTIKPCNRLFCMVASPDTATDPTTHPFWYIRKNFPP
ncbi:hypothetical protein NP233_g10562 [Leucocoprinus birnbaumii]|uniref:Uncharacterized protein n=1 Tax=Leucocoprinus birnbaumii TaxID=56174 RepID=A0AAD5VK41_9AGAR|nr:hypothetical protein NP233_g10562 [Leucocoprinus birnbaumii]